MSFCTAINCMDGRVQLPVIQFLQDLFGVEYVDMITAPGPVRILAQQDNPPIVDAILERVAISVQKHGSTQIAVVAHHDCAGNPADRDAQVAQVRQSIDFLKGRFPQVEFEGLWVNENWDVEAVDLAEAT